MKTNVSKGTIGMKKLVRLRLACWVDFYHSVDDADSDEQAEDLVLEGDSDYIGYKICDSLDGGQEFAEVVDCLPAGMKGGCNDGACCAGCN